MNKRLGRPQEQVMEAAMRMIAERGMAALTLADLGRELDTSAGHLLYYFKTKDGLLMETLRWSEAQLQEPRRAIQASRAAPARKLARFVDLYLPTGAGDPRWLLWVELWSRALRDDVLRQAQRELDGAWRADLEGLLENACLTADAEAVGISGWTVRLLAMLDGFSADIVTGAGSMTRSAARGHVVSTIRMLLA